MNTLRVVNAVRISAPTSHRLARYIQTMVPVNHAVETTPPLKGMRSAWHSLQQDSWVTTQSYIEPLTFDTVNTMAETKSILGTRNLGLFEEIPKSERRETKPKFGSLLRALRYSKAQQEQKYSSVG